MHLEQNFEFYRSGRVPGPIYRVKRWSRSKTNIRIPNLSFFSKILRGSKMASLMPRDHRSPSSASISRFKLNLWPTEDFFLKPLEAATFRTFRTFRIVRTFRTFRTFRTLSNLSDLSDLAALFGPFGSGRAPLPIL